MQKLTDILINSAAFSDTENPNSNSEDFIPPDRKDIFLKLAEKFQTAISYIYDDPEELAVSTNMGTAEMWDEFLQLEPVKFYIAIKSKNLAGVQARKSMKNLQKAAAKGDVAAIKYLNEVSGIMQKQGDDNKQIVLHYVPRPKINKGNKITNQPKEV